MAETLVREATALYIDETLALTIAYHTMERNAAEQSGNIVYVSVAMGDNKYRPAGAIMSMERFLKAMLTTPDESIAIFWLDRTPVEHVREYPTVRLSSIVYYSMNFTDVMRPRLIRGTLRG